SPAGKIQLEADTGGPMVNRTRDHHDHDGHQHHNQSGHQHDYSGHEHHAHHAHGATAADTAQDADKPFTDPVCGMKVAANPAKRIEHAGADYYFCSTRCMDKFRANPQQ